MCVARALAYKPEILLLDEPCAALDPINAENVEALVRGLKGLFTTILVSHHVDLVERVADHAIFLREGRAIESGAVPSLLSSPRKQSTREILDRRAAPDER